MALRRGQGDVRLNLQYADFFLTHKQFERWARNAGVVGMARAWPVHGQTTGHWDCLNCSP